MRKIDFTKTSTDNICLVDAYGNTTSVRDAVQKLALATYEDYLDAEKRNLQGEELERFKEKINLQMKVLNALSNAENAVRTVHSNGNYRL